MTISITDAQEMISELKEHEISLGRAPETWYTYHNHVYGVAEIAKVIASQIPTMDADHFYVMGLLHDICRTEDDRAQRFHGILGYEKLVSLDEDVARICLLHSFPQNELPPYQECAKLFYYKEKDYQFVSDFIQQNTPREEDYLIQLCDGLANKDGFVTIEQRAAEIIERHTKLNVAGSMDISKVNEIKQHFDKKIKCDIYSLPMFGKSKA